MFHKSFTAMNTRLGFVLWGNDEQVYPSVYHEIENHILSIEKVISRYDSSAELYRVNQNAYYRDMEVSPKLYEAVKLAISYHYLTNGYFNVALGTNYHALKHNKPPIYFPDEKIEDLIVADENKLTIRFCHPSVSIDFGGMGKGLALKTLDKLLENYGISNAFVSFGESSVLTRGHHPHGQWWPFALDKGFGVDKEWKLNNSSVSVSQTLRGSQGAHIVDPIGKKIIDKWKLALVQALNPIDAEVLSTTLLCAPPNLHHSILANFEIEDHIIVTK
jgi:FAD:protein FMN transferase